MPVILVTGGASGLGAAITKKFASHPEFNVYFTFNNSKESAAKIEAEFKNTTAIQCDFTDQESLTKLVKLIPLINLDILINNALTGMQIKHFHQILPEDLARSFEKNVLPTMIISQEAIKAFRKKKSGRILSIITSYVANSPPVGLSEYVANKAYLLSMSKSWAKENSRYNIVSNCVSPSLLMTNLVGALDQRQIEDMESAHPFKCLLTVDEVADSVFSLAIASKHVNGVNFLMNGGVDVI